MIEKCLFHVMTTTTLSLWDRKNISGHSFWEDALSEEPLIKEVWKNGEISFQENLYLDQKNSE